MDLFHKYCTNAPDSGAPDQVHFIGKFHLKVPDLDLLFPGAFRHQWSMTTHLIVLVIVIDSKPIAMLIQHVCNTCVLHNKMFSFYTKHLKMS